MENTKRIANLVQSVEINMRCLPRKKEKGENVRKVGEW